MVMYQCYWTRERCVMWWRVVSFVMCCAGRGNRHDVSGCTYCAVVVTNGIVSGVRCVALLHVIHTIV